MSMGVWLVAYHSLLWVRAALWYRRARTFPVRVGEKTAIYTWKVLEKPVQVLLMLGRVLTKVFL